MLYAQKTKRSLYDRILALVYRWLCGGLRMGVSDVDLGKDSSVGLSMQIFEMHAQVEGNYWKALVVAENEQEAIKKFRNIFRLADSTRVSLEKLKLDGIIVI